MRHLRPGPAVRILLIVPALLLFFSAGLLAQTQAPQARPGTLHGQVTDPSGASVANATVKLTTPNAQILTRTTDANGAFEITNLEPGNYSLAVSVTCFATKEQALQITAGQLQQLTISLEVATQQQEVTVAEVAPTVDASPSNNAGAIAMSGNDLEALPDDPDQLQADLQALAGTGGPEGGQIFIDGFTGGTLPPKSSIREIKINQNPFAAEFDQLGFGRIEILTKPGTDQLHGRFAVLGNTSGFNTSSPYVLPANQEPYHSVIYDGSISGSYRHKASFALAAFRRNINDSTIVNAIVLDPGFNPVPFTAGVGTPQELTNLSPRLDYQLTLDNTLTARYQYSRNVRTNGNVGGFALPSQADDALTNEHLIQLIDSQVIGERAVNEMRFQYIHNATGQTAQNSDPSIRVTGAFTGGGSPRGIVLSTTRSYELQNNTSLISGPHIFKFGGRLRASQLVSDSTNNFNGTFTFPSIAAYQLTLQGMQQGLTSAQIRANGGGPNQFTISAGLPRATATLVDAGLYVQDDWKVRSNVTLSGGLRFEPQDDIPDHSDLAPRIGLAWSFGKKARPTVIRTGFGLFYNRFPVNNTLQLDRFNGVTQQQYIVTNPDFYPAIPPVTTLAGALTSPTVYSLAPDFRSGYYMQGAVTIEQQLSKVANLSVNVFRTRGVHRAIQSNINAPLPGSITAANPAGTRPFPNQGNIYQYISASDYTGYYTYAALNIRAGAKLTLMGNYGLGWARANAVPGNGGFSSNPYNLNQDWGRSAGETRQQAFLGGSIALPRGFRASPFVIVVSGAAYSITEGQDLNGDSIFNDRPGFVTGQTLPQNIVVTPYGTFDKAPAPGAPIIPIDSVRGPGRATVNLTLGRTFNLTKAPPRPAAAGAGGATGLDALKAAAGAPGGPAFGPRRYTLTFNISARNIFNRVNRGNPVGNLSSPLFGQVNSLAGGPFTTGAAVRRVDLQLVFAF